MPSSRYDCIPFVLDLVTKWQPRSILDAGIGYGKYGVLFREYLDIWKVTEPYSKRILRLIGVEAFEEYRNPIWDVYDKVLIGDMNEEKVKVELAEEKFGLLFLGDVIEHFDKEEGKKLLGELNYDKIIIVTPLHVSEQEAVYDNKFEIHKSSWKWQDLPGLQLQIIGNTQVFYG